MEEEKVEEMKRSFFSGIARNINEKIIKPSDRQKVKELAKKTGNSFVNQLEHTKAKSTFRGKTGTNKPEFYRNKESKFASHFSGSPFTRK